MGGFEIRLQREGHDHEHAFEERFEFAEACLEAFRGRAGEPSGAKVDVVAGRDFGQELACELDQIGVVRRVAHAVEHSAGFWGCG